MGLPELKSVKLHNGETISYREQGSGRTVYVLLHGNMTSSAHFDIVFEQMSTDIRLITPDLRGFGGSSYYNPINHLEDFAEDIIELINHLDIDNFYIGGWSTGGGIALEIASKLSRRVLGLVLIESVGIEGYPMFKKDETGQPIIGEFLKTKEEIATDPVQVLPIITAYENKDKETLKFIWNSLIYTHNQPNIERYAMYLDDMLTQRNLVDVDYALVYFNMSNKFNGVVVGNKKIETIKCQVLVFQGDRDLVVPKQMGDGIKAALGEQVEYVTGDWGHSPMIDCPQYLMDKMLAFIK